MSAWTWVLIGLCAGGVLLALIPLVAVVRLALRLRSRVNNLQNARLFTALESLQLQRAHFESIAAQAAPLAQRAQRAVETIRASAATAAYADMRDSLRSAGADISELIAALR
jgi:hypothetical protein